MSAKPTLKITSDFTKEFNDVISKFKKDAVLVGIPADDKERDDDSPISNAALLAINNFGSPANNIPAWPVMSIGIKNAKDAIAAEFKKAAQGALSKGVGALEVCYERAGIIASNSVKKTIKDQMGAPQLSDNTIAIRRAGGFSKWTKTGADLGSFNYTTKQVKKEGGFLGTKRLIVTGQVRNAITYVVKNIWGR